MSLPLTPSPCLFIHVSLFMSPLTHSPCLLLYVSAMAKFEEQKAQYSVEVAKRRDLEERLRLSVSELGSLREHAQDLSLAGERATAQAAALQAQLRKAQTVRDGRLEELEAVAKVLVVPPAFPVPGVV